MKKQDMEKGNYGKFALTITVSFIIMYVVMFLNVFETDQIYLSLDRFYMTLLMVSSMALLMLGMMKAMYKNKKLNSIIVISAILVFVLAFAALRKQTGIGDVQYMRGMIPHHSSAILTSTNANIKDPQVRKLADNIIAAQKKEIAEMKSLIKRLER